MDAYFCGKRNIKLCLQLLDARRTLSGDDGRMTDFLRARRIPFAVVLTKCDKLGKRETEERLAALKEEIGEYLTGVNVVPFSALNGTGVEALREIIEKNS